MRPSFTDAIVNLAFMGLIVAAGIVYCAVLALARYDGREANIECY
jgi:hypothetical protein